MAKSCFPSIKQLPVLSFALVAMGCTGQLPGSFRLAQQEELFSSQLQINTKIDLLWVVDNSSSMDVSQEKLRAGFEGFARKYMQPTWDIRVAVITTDAYLANPKFAGFLDSVISGSVGYSSDYMSTKAKPVTNPIYDNDSKTFLSGIRYKDLITAWGSDYAKLLPGLHDGPIPALCFEELPYFIGGVSQCAVRDDGSNTGIENCLTPGAGEASVSQCVNTVENNTVRSGKAIVSTTPETPLSGAALTAWTDQLIRDFRVNVTTGSAGHGSERGFASVLQLLNDNETAETAFFRKNSFRGIVFVSDEDDQSMIVPETPPASFSPFSNYACDEASLLTLNSGNPEDINGVNGYCCSDPAKNCRYGANGTSCPAKTVDGYTYRPSICPLEDKLIAVEDVKTSLDSFFTALDGESNASSYFVVSIVPTTEAAVKSLQLSRDNDDENVGMNIRSLAVDRGDRYLKLGELVGNGSIALNIAENDYSPVLDQIGKSIIEHKSVFTLVRAPTGTEEMIVRVFRADGSVETIPADKFVVDGKKLIITDLDLVLGFSASDQISINYQPKTLF